MSIDARSRYGFLSPSVVAGGGLHGVSGGDSGSGKPPSEPIGFDEQGSASHCAALDAMERFGGSFVQNLARAWKRADRQNHERLLAGFRHYLVQYGEMAAREMGFKGDTK